MKRRLSARYYTAEQKANWISVVKAASKQTGSGGASSGHQEEGFARSDLIDAITGLGDSRAGEAVTYLIKLLSGPLAQHARAALCRISDPAETRVLLQRL